LFRTAYHFFFSWLPALTYTPYYLHIKIIWYIIFVSFRVKKIR
jgi:hypothetical protein